MKIAAYQFAVSADITNNYRCISNAAREAAGKGARILLLPECALCGYPPLESKMNEIDDKLLEEKEQALRALAAQLKLSIAAGTIRAKSGNRYNALMLADGETDTVVYYDKRALWGWDLEHFSPGDPAGLTETAGWKIGLRICFEVRFPEYFRELYRGGAELCLVSFCDHAEQENSRRYEIMTSCLRTRAMENLLPLLSCNSISRHQTAPTALFDRNGNILAQAPQNQEYLLIAQIEKTEDGFGEKGRRLYSDALTSPLEKRV